VNSKKDNSIGSITVGVISHGDLVWTKSCGFGDMSTPHARRSKHRLRDRIRHQNPLPPYFGRTAYLDVVVLRNLNGPAVHTDRLAMDLSLIFLEARSAKPSTP
jgi:hypothetical protein